MMIYQRALIALIAAVLVASCTPEVGDYDWCYYYDFAVGGDYGFAVSAGEYVTSESEGGFWTDETGLLSVSYAYTQIVEPLSVLVYIQRPAGIVGDISIVSAGQVYGVPVASSQTLPAALDGAIVQFQPANVGDGSASINVTMESSQTIIIQRLDVSGMGVSPFPSNPCDKRTATPSNTPPPSATFVPTIAPSSTPTIPATVTGTSTQTPTPAPTSTPFCIGTWQYTWSFTSGTTPHGNWRISQAVYTSGVGYQTSFQTSGGFGYRTAHIEFVAPVTPFTLTSYEVTLINVSQPFAAPAPTQYLSHKGATSYPFSVLASRTLPNGNSTYSWTGSTTNVSYLVSLNVVGRRSSNADPGGNATITSVSISGTGGNPLNDLTGGTLTCTLASTPTPIATNTPIPTSTGTPVPTNTPIPTATRTPLPPPATSTATRTPIPISTTTPRPTATATGTATPLPPPTFTPPPTNTPGGPTNTPAPTLDVTPTFATGTPNATPTIVGGTPTQIATGTPTPGLPPGVGDQYSDGVGELQNAVGNAVANAEGLASTMGSWLGTGVGLMTGIIDDFINAPPEAVPGLPTCASNPTAHDLCAIYYILKFTLFAPGTPGALILPLALIAYNIFAIFIFVRYLLVLVRRGMEAIQG